MNLLEHYIVNVYEVKTLLNPHNGEKYCIVDMDVDCYGQLNRVMAMFQPKEWKEIQERGYYMA